MKNVTTNLSSLKNKADQLHLDKLVLAVVDLSKLIDVVKDDVVTKDVDNALTAVENKISNVSNLIKKLTIRQKLVKLKKELLLIMIMINILLLKNLKIAVQDFYV